MGRRLARQPVQVHLDEPDALDPDVGGQPGAGTQDAALGVQRAQAGGDQIDGLTAAQRGDLGLGVQALAQRLRQAIERLDRRESAADPELEPLARTRRSQRGEQGGVELGRGGRIREDASRSSQGRPMSLWVCKDRRQRGWARQ